MFIVSTYEHGEPGVRAVEQSARTDDDVAELDEFKVLVDPLRSTTEFSLVD